MYKKLITALLVMSFNIVAYAGEQQHSDNSAANTESNVQDAIYCPQEIECVKDGNLASCKAVGGSSQYWGTMREDGRVIAGKYTFRGAGSQYQLPPEQQHYAGCAYLNTDSGFEKTISIGVKKEANYLEALIKNGKWYVSGYGAGCNNVDSAACPLTRVSAMGVTADITDDDVYKTVGNGSIYANGSMLEFTGISPDFRLISYERLLPYCGKKLCTITFKGWKSGIGQYDIGNVIVDMNDNMKILQVNPLPSNGFTIKQADGLNNVEIVKIKA